MQKIDVKDLRPTIIPKADQLNADQLLGGPMVVTVTDVRVVGGDDQPVSIHYRNDNGRPYKPCKTMRKVLIHAWGPDGSQWVGRSMELFNDPAVRWGGEEVGGIRIARLTDIPKNIRVALTATKGKKTLHDIGVLKPPAKPVRSERHDEIVTNLERIARADGFDVFKAEWDRLPKDDKAAIGRGERDRIALIAQEAQADAAEVVEGSDDAPPVDDDFVRDMQAAEARGDE